MPLDRYPLTTFSGIERGRQVKLGDAISDARNLIVTHLDATRMTQTLTSLGYGGTVDQTLTAESRYPVTIPEGTRGVVEAITNADTALVAFVWRTPKSNKITATLCYVDPAQCVNHRGAPPLPGEAIPAAAATTTTKEDLPPVTAPATAPNVAPGSLDAMLAAIVDARVGARIEALEAELAARPANGGAVRVQINALPEQKLSGAAHAMLPTLLQWCASIRRNGQRHNVALVGDAGTGKSVLAEQVAEALGLPFGFLNCSGGVSESRLFGRMTPNLSTGIESYTSTPLVDTYRNGGVFLLDEMDGLDANVLTGANGLLEGKRWTAPNGETIERSPDAVFLACMNTFGTGASRLYTGRTQLDAASLDRWVILEVDYDENLERSLCSVAEIVDQFHSIRATARRLGLRRWVTGRMIERAETAHVCHGLTVRDAVKQQLSGWSAADLSAVGF